MPAPQSRPSASLLPFLLMLLLALPPRLGNAALETGAPVPAVALEDQHGKPVSIAPGTRLVLFAADKAASDLVTAALDGQPADLLARRDAVYLADISAMPALVTRLFALPAMRAQAYPIGLARDAALLAELPRQRGAVTLLRLANGKLAEVDYLHDAGQIRHALDLR